VTRPIFETGDILSDTYEIRGLLGAGGMGQVFDAHDRGLNRRVAIKANYADTSQQFTIRQEAQALAAVRHPGVVAVHALGTHGGVDYMVMEHVSGVTLAHHLQRLEEKGLPLAERLDILIATADGLAAIHRAGLSHGDVKPDNILLAASGRVVLTDLGLVRPDYDREQGIVAGTPDYMAPEIFTPRVPPTSRHLVDEYAFGILAYRVVVGRHPFEGSGPIELLMLHATAPVPKMPGPKRLAELVESLLAKDPLDRPPTMDQVVWQLRAAKDAAAKDTGAATSPLSVLVVDDDPDIRKLVGMYVKQAAPHAEVSVAGGADEALEQFRKKPPRLVFLDLMMPKMSGFELFTYLRGVHLVDASTVVAMSAGGSMTDIELMLELGVHDFIPKGAHLRQRVMKIVSTLASET
jgi:eukaryotic-like serine/threonine-protein kinase